MVQLNKSKRRTRTKNETRNQAGEVGKLGAAREREERGATGVVGKTRPASGDGVPYGLMAGGNDCCGGDAGDVRGSGLGDAGVRACKRAEGESGVLGGGVAITVCVAGCVGRCGV